MIAHYRTMMQRGTWRPDLTPLIPKVVEPVPTGHGITGQVRCKRCDALRHRWQPCRSCLKRKREGQR